MFGTFQVVQDGNENGPSWSNRASIESYLVEHWSLTAQYPSGISARLFLTDFCHEGYKNMPLPKFAIKKIQPRLGKRQASAIQVNSNMWVSVSFLPFGVYGSVDGFDIKEWT